MKGLCQIYSSTRIKDAGIATRHSRGYIISILQGPEMGLREWTRCVPGHTKQVEPIKNTNLFRCVQVDPIFVIDKYVENVKQAEKHDPNR